MRRVKIPGRRVYTCWGGLCSAGLCYRVCFITITKCTGFITFLFPSGAARTTLTEQAEIVDRHNELRLTSSPRPATSRPVRGSPAPAARTSWTNAAQAWYDEVHDFRYGVGSINGDVVGLYTQVVWYGSNQISCAVTYCPNATYKWPLLPPGQLLADPPLQVRADLRRMPRHRDNNPCLYNDQYSNFPELQQRWGCSHSDVASWCPASCRRTNQII
uniref:ShKT domain-containing protein n=1 Tax=Poecilia mexicana TaxID=48701 RepID=A0A3B3YUG0_9TELE